MSARAAGEPVKWYRCQISREDLARLNRRSDLMGFVQTLGFLSVLAATGTGAFLASLYWPWYAVVPVVLLHGACWHFLINGFHELIHDSVFKTRALNRFFLRIFSFLGQYSHVAFWASHTEHHKFTLHPPDDLEVVLPQKYTLKGFLKGALVNIRGPEWFIKNNLRIAQGKLCGQWEHHLFGGNPKEYRKLVNWARFLLAAHLAIAALACYFHLYMLVVLITLAPHYGGGLHFLCNASQHAGLYDNAPDFRLCCRTVYLNPALQFLYWNMNYHTEHHMYAAVPCYNLPELHRLIKKDMPWCPNGLYETWTHIAGILKQQAQNPEYKYIAALPSKRASVKKPAEMPAPVSVQEAAPQLS